MPSYSDSEMRAIMGRALQIDSGRSERFTPEQLRTIAAELGISTQALEVAMYEADAGARGMTVPPAAAPRPSVFAKYAAIALAVVVVALATLMFTRQTPAPRRIPAGQDFVSEAAPARPVQPTRKMLADPPTTPTPVAPEGAPVNPTKNLKKTTKRQ